jgi:hypothetical protein
MIEIMLMLGVDVGGGLHAVAGAAVGRGRWMVDMKRFWMLEIECDVQNRQ